MSCPNNPEFCEIVFDTEDMDSGDGPYLMSWIQYIYDGVNSFHVLPCTGLTEKQIEDLERERTEEGPDYSWMDP